MHNITLKEVNEMYLDIFFKKTKRINLKMYSHAVFEEAKLVEKRQTYKQVNKEFYKKMEEYFKVEFKHQ